MSVVVDRLERAGPGRASMLQTPLAVGKDPAALSQDTVSQDPPLAMSPTYVPGPFDPVYPSGLKPLASRNGLLEEPGFASGGFHPHSLETASDEAREAYCHEPQSVVVTAMFVGLVLAGMGYAFGIQ